MRVEEQLTKLKVEIEQLKTKQIQIQEQLRLLDQEKVSLLQKCTDLGVDPRQIEEAIKAQEEQIQQAVRDIQAAIQAFQNA